MLKRPQFLLLTGLGALALALALTNILLSSWNRSVQGEINARGQYIQQSVQLEPIYQGLIRGLADLSARQNDAQLHELLASQGIHFTLNPPTREQTK